MHTSLAHSNDPAIIATLQKLAANNKAIPLIEKNPEQLANKKADSPNIYLNINIYKKLTFWRPTNYCVCTISFSIFFIDACKMLRPTAASAAICYALNSIAIIWGTTTSTTVTTTIIRATSARVIRAFFLSSRASAARRAA